VETYNDIDGEVANFFRVLRDNKDELVEKIGLTPFAREEFYKAVTKNLSGWRTRLNVQDFSTHERVKLAQVLPKRPLLVDGRTVRIRAELECPESCPVGSERLKTCRTSQCG